MAFTITYPVAGYPAIGSIGTTQAVPYGTMVDAVDPTLGAGTFVYAKGLASTAAGDAVAINVSTGVTTRTVAATRGTVGVATAALVANTFGWYQVRGITAVTSGTVASGAAMFSTATPGSVDDAVVTGSKIDGMVSVAANSGGTTLCTLFFPSMNNNG